MPFTISHAAAVLPLERMAGPLLVLSALVVGSLAPDLIYFVPLSISRGDTHTLVGVFRYCLPIGMFTWLLYFFFARRPLFTLLPVRIQQRMADDLLASLPLTFRSAAAVLTSIVVGALTHVIWDSFTHGDTVVTRTFSFFNVVVFDLGGVEVFVCEILQHLSSLFGLIVVVWWMSHRYSHPTASRTTRGHLRRHRMDGDLRWAVWVGLVSLPLFLAAGRAMELGLQPDRWLFDVRNAAQQGFFLGVSGFISLVGIYCLVWHGYQIGRGVIRWSATWSRTRQNSSG